MPQDQVYTNAESDFSTKSIPSYDYGNQFNSSNPSNIQNPASSNGTQAFNMQHNQGYPAPNDGYIDSWSNQVPVQNFTAQGMQCTSEALSAASFDYSILVASIYQYADDCL